MMKGGGLQIVGAMEMNFPVIPDHHQPWDDHDDDIAAAKGCTRLNAELSDWVEQVTKHLINDSTATVPSHHHHQTIITHDPQNHHHNYTLLQHDDHDQLSSVDNYYINPPTEKEEEDNIVINDMDDELQQQSSLISLMTHLLESAVAISVDNLGEAHRMLLELTQMASPYAASSAERVVAYFSKAMSSRVINSWLGICHPLVNHRTIHAAVQLFNNISPITKFAHFTSNQAILESLHHRRIHIIDLDIMQGLQWPALFHILATTRGAETGSPPHVRMTGFGPDLAVLMETGKNLSAFAKRLGLSFEFQPIAKRFGDVDVSAVHVRPGEAVAVHWVRHSLYDAIGADWKAIRILQQLSPRIITLVEPEMSLGGSFLDRFVGSLHFYSTVFDSLGAYLGSDDPGRHRVEQCLLYQEINNIVAIGGPARSGEEKFRSWRNELGRAGFGQVAMSSNSMAQAQLILNMFPPAHGYSLGQGDGTLRLGWKQTSLYTASAWTSSHVIPT